MHGLSIGGLAKLANVSIDTIRFYDKAGLLAPHVRRPSGFREYSLIDLKRLTFIRRGRLLGFSLEEIGEFLTLKGGPASDMVHRQLQVIDRRIEELTRWRRGLLDFLEAPATVDPGGHSILDCFNDESTGAAIGQRSSRDRRRNRKEIVMTNFDPLRVPTWGMSRRRFLTAAGAGLFVLGSARTAWPQKAQQSVLSGTEFDLQIGETSVNFTGKPRIGTVVNGQIPAPLLRWREGDTITLRVSNRLPVRSSIHWHGMIVPADMDGVPGLSFEGIPSGGTYVYRFKVNQYGTYWYHAHSRFQEQTGLYGRDRQRQ